MSYDDLLKKAREELPESISGRERFEIPKVIGHIQGNRTIISNFFQIAKVLGREPEHLLKYVLKELAAPGKLSGQQLVIGTKISSSIVNKKIKQYANIYVLCAECGKPDTKLTIEGGIYSLKCTACGAKHPVRLI